ncbi:MAG: hypothetical protein K2P51_01605 [Rhabdochlamydiaceae bacterium]|nr:hypothetical protein [Rhabdochlamydiaceae bacterium]
MKRPLPRLALTHALAWIVGSSLVTSVCGHLGFRAYFAHVYKQANDPQYKLRTLVQTGPQKQALKTEYLAELLGLSSDAPASSLTYDLRAAEQKLRASPLIEQVQLKMIQPGTLYVDYTVRQPVAWLYDYENVAIDKEGHPFPFRPFFTPKNLPELYFGMGPFGIASEDPDRPVAKWGAPISGKYAVLALHLLSLLSDLKIQELFQVKRIDVSQAFAESYGSREIVVIVEDKILEKQIEFFFPKILRLSTQNYAQDLGNYLTLRPKLLEQERKSIRNLSPGQAIVRAKEKILDFRIQNLAFIDEAQEAL